MRWLIALLVVVGTGLSASAESPARVQLQPGAHASVRLRVGQSLEVRLAANPSTGYGWEIVGGDPSIIAFVGRHDEPTAASSRPQVTGAPDVQVLIFKTKAFGKTDLVLGYARPWEKGSAPVHTAKLSVTVRD
jgi:inhibitor of cysteine peptidase